ncbi:Nn.00g097540.m01.CDS01 [Neocucurbitaria sp. VM-36]
MLGIDYASSDEEDVVPATKPEPPALSGPVNGPSQAPTVTPPPAEEESNDKALPGSPYTSNRALVQNLTLPTVPNFDIPPSPPGSPSQRATNKFAQFLELKKKGQHFNQRIEGSSVLRDPGHLQRLLDFAGISEEDSHMSTLSEDIAVPAVFPDWAYVEELRASQKRSAKAQEQERSKAPRETINFVSATKSVALDKEQASSLSSQNTSKRKELEHRSRESSSSGGARRGGSRSPKRKR